VSSQFFILLLKEYSSRNQVFIQFPGRDIGGIWAVFKPLAVNAWIGTLAFVVVVPLFLFLCYRVLISFGMREKFSFSYGQNVFILFNGISQQVIMIPWIIMDMYVCYQCYQC
jgi:hypothetical protein